MVTVANAKLGFARPLECLNPLCMATTVQRPAMAPPVLKDAPGIELKVIFFNNMTATPVAPCVALCGTLEDSLTQNSRAPSRFKKLCLCWSLGVAGCLTIRLDNRRLGHVRAMSERFVRSAHRPRPKPVNLKKCLACMADLVLERRNEYQQVGIWQGVFPRHPLGCCLGLALVPASLKHLARTDVRYLELPATDIVKRQKELTHPRQNF